MMWPYLPLRNGLKGADPCLCGWVLSPGVTVILGSSHTCLLILWGGGRTGGSCCFHPAPMKMHHIGLAKVSPWERQWT